MTTPSAWHPTEVRRVVRPLATGAETVIVETDSGTGYLKAMGNCGGEHILACEWVATQLARWFGLPTFDFALIEVRDEDGIVFYGGTPARPGPAFITRKERGQSWGTRRRQLQRVVNQDDITRLVVFDTWTRNWDRYSADGKRQNYDNVFLSEEAPPGQFLLKAIDHTHCFTWGRDLTGKLSHIDNQQDRGIYGLFPEFRPLLKREILQEAVGRLGEIREEDVRPIVDGIPRAWDVSDAARAALVTFAVGRARFLGDTMERELWPQMEFKFPD